MVTNELRGERVDVVPFSDDPVELIQSALAPARVREVRLDDDTGTATVIVSDYQLSLAIGKEGQNARLAARLTGWRIDIKSETQLADEESGYSGEEWAEGEWVQNDAGEMVWQPAEGGTAVSATEWSQGAEGLEAASPTTGDPVVEEAAGTAASPVATPTEAAAGDPAGTIHGDVPDGAGGEAPAEVSGGDASGGSSA
jgi:N utilization substance protein A